MLLKIKNLLNKFIVVLNLKKTFFFFFWLTVGVDEWVLGCYINTILPPVKIYWYRKNKFKGDYA